MTPRADLSQMFQVLQKIELAVIDVESLNRVDLKLA